MEEASISSRPSSEGGDNKPPKIPLAHSLSWQFCLFYLVVVGVQAAFLEIGLTGQWLEVPLDTRETTEDSLARDDDTARTDTEALFKGGFWFTVQQFWYSGAKAVAGLVVASGEVQPIWNLAAFLFLFFYPLSTFFREFLIKLMEIGGKVCFASFFVEALIMPSFHFTFEYDKTIVEREYHVVSKVGLDIYSPLSLYLTSQCMAIFTISLLQYAHRIATGERFFHPTESEKSDTLEYYPLTESEGHQTKPKGRSQTFRARVFLCSTLALISMACAYFIPFIRLKSSGLLAGYITKYGPDAKLDIYDLLKAVYEIPKPQQAATYLSCWASLLLVIVPIIVPLCGLISAVLPDKYTTSHMRLETLCFFLQPWCATEALVIAAFFLAPNLKTITTFVFDDTDPCPTIDQDLGEECLVTTGTLLPGGCIALIAWATLTFVSSHSIMLHRRGAPPPYAPSWDHETTSPVG